MDQHVGTEVAGYRIESVIGRGGMGVVYLAQDLHLQRRVALKVLAPELAQDDKFRERFVRESQLAASLDHPNIIPIFDAREAGTTLYLAMRYVPGMDLKTLIGQEGPLAPERTIAILRQAASALDTAHAEGLIHRDVKPGNILITPRTESGGTDRVFLSDFGLTKRASSDSGMTATGQFVGTLDYAAPEQFEGRPLDARTDVYSLGCVLYECLTRDVPFPRENQAALVYAHLMASPPKVTDKRPDLPPAIDDVFSKAVAKSPQDRYQSAGVLIEAAGEALGSEDTPVTSTPTRPVAIPPGPGRRRGQARVAVGWAAIVAVIVLVVVLLTRGGGGHAGQGAQSAGPSKLADYVARVDPSTRQVTSRIKVGRNPAAVALGEGSAWVANEGDNTVSRIDPPTGKVTRIAVGREPRAIAVGDEGVWVTNHFTDSVQEIDPATNRVVATVGLGFPPADIALGGREVWIIGQSQTFECTLIRLDPTTRRVGGSTKVVLPSGPLPGRFAVAAAADSIWAGSFDGTLWQFDPASMKLERSINLEKPISDLLIQGASLWVATEGTPGVVFEVDASSGEVLATISAGGGGGQGVGPGRGRGAPRLGADRTSLWVTDGANGSVSRLVTVSGQVNPPIALGTLPTGVAAGLGSVWVTVDGQ